MIDLNNVSLNLGNKQLLKDLSLRLSAKHKIGIVGRNGSGKSTLLKLINGTYKPDEGTVGIKKDATIAYMPQDLIMHSSQTVLDEAFSVFEKQLAEKHELEALIKTSENHDGTTCPIETIERIHDLSEKLRAINFKQLKDKTRQTLAGLGFSQEQMDQKTNQLSVGWKMRLLLAKLLLLDADFYLFDEPTNHLDITAHDWFLKFIQNAPFGFLLVSHDRYFLDHACTQILDLDQHPNKLYKGNYSTFLVKKEHDLELLKSAAANQEKMLKAKMATIDRFRAKSSKAKMAQSMLREVEKIEKIQLPPELPPFKLRFSDVERSGKIVLEIKKLEKSFPPKTIFKNISFQLQRGEKAAIVAANGKGKTTLLSCIMGSLTPEHGTVKIGHNVKAAIFEQDQDKVLDGKKTVLEEAIEACKTSEQRSKVRTLLGSFLFPGDDVGKKMSVLSGGEKNRVAMVKVLLQNANLLLLDEPTNHLDLQSKEILLKALKTYPGTILFVSHDRDFLDGLATRIFELNSDSIHSYEGNYESYLYQSRGLLEASSEKTPMEENNVTKKKSGAESHKMRKQIARAEEKVEKLEKQIAQMSQKFSNFEYGTDEFEQNNAKIAKLELEMEQATKMWEDLIDEPN
ncbi:ABC-F family ATP-binding cassette domain-containing protein [Candidatus Babeliales bacterium]|nr:ABC-F family ATP-binding cassette domain-containing protein [Candidatus Babeliales bacterium]